MEFFSKLLGLAHRLFAIELRRLQQRRVAYTEKQRVVSNKVSVAVRAPIGHHKAVALGPTKRLISRDGLAFALNYEVDRSGGMAVRFGFFPAAQHLDVAIHGWERGAPGERINIFEDHAVVRAAFLARQALQSIESGRPFVGHG